jgi:N-acetylglucosamine-6-phosphate deacetylase
MTPLSQNLPFLAPFTCRDPFAESESLGAHCDEPFFAHNRMGVHLPDANHASGATSEPERVLETYGSSNLVDSDDLSKRTSLGSVTYHVRMTT